MNARQWVLVVAACACFGLPGAAHGQDVAASAIEAIDPFEPGAGDFLDVDLDAYRELAREAYESKQYKKAAQAYLALLHHNVGDSRAIYNLACCYALLGKADLAAAALERAVRAGYDDLECLADNPDFDAVREADALKAVVERIGLDVQARTEHLGERVHVISSVYTRCRIRLPEGFDPERPHTLVIGLHPLWSDADEFAALWDRFEKPDFIFAVPQASYPLIAGGRIGYSWGLRDSAGPGMTRTSLSLSEQFVTSVLRLCQKRYTIGDVYVLGFSQGGSLALTSGIRFHEQITGVISFGGWIGHHHHSEKALEAGKELRVFMAHGTEDSTVPFETGTALRDTLTALGYDVTFHQFDGGHTIDDDALKAAQAWMRQPAPATAGGE